MLHLFLLIAKKENKTDILEREDAAIVDTE